MTRAERIQKVQKIQQIAEANPNGFTVHLDTLEHVTRGISFGYAETQDSFGVEGINHVLDVCEDLLINTIGGWLDDGKYYFDAVRIFPNYERADAIHFGILNRQICGWDITNNKPVSIPK